MTEIQRILYAHSDTKYADFTAKLIPTLPRERFIGVRSPEYRKIQKELPGEPAISAFLAELPHEYHEENCLHGVLLGRMKDFDACLAAVERFLPHVDNWAVCDGLNPAVFAKHRDRLMEKVPQWLASEAVYTRRFGMRMVMVHFLDEDFEPALLRQTAALRSEEYYVNMMTAWLFAEALVKQWDAVIPYITEHRLDKWTHNKAIQKACESFRITEEQKSYLKTLRMK